MEDEVPPLRIQTEFCVCVCVALWVCFITLSKLQRRKKKTAHRNTEKQGHEGQKESRHVVSLLPSIVLAEAARAFLFYILEISSIYAALLLLSLSGCQTLPASIFLFSFFSPQFSSHTSESNELYAPYTQYLCWHSRSSRSYTSGLQLHRFYVRFLFLEPRRRGWRECRQIKAETDRYGNMPSGICLFTADSLQEAWASACFLKTENTSTSAVAT